MNTQVSAQDLQKKITGYLDDLARETDQARKSEAMQKFLDFAGRFHQYSPSNIFLIMLAKPDATQVAGFQTWKKLGRYVRKGEKGIPIFAPLIHKEDLDDDNSPKVLHGFRVVFVFDLSQTNGEPLPPIPDWKSPEKNAELTEKLIRFAESKGINVIFKDLSGETQGVSKGGEIEISPNAGTKTLIHEISHELMHRKGCPSNDRNVREMEAEAVAYSVARFYKIDGLKSPNYIALQGIDAERLRSRMVYLQSNIAEIITGVEPIGQIK